METIIKAPFLKKRFFIYKKLTNTFIAITSITITTNPIKIIFFLKL